MIKLGHADVCVFDPEGNDIEIVAERDAYA